MNWGFLFVALVGLVWPSTLMGQANPDPAYRVDPPGTEPGDGLMPQAAAPQATLKLPEAAAPAPGPFDAPAGPPAYRPALPAGTPEEHRQADPAAPVGSLVDALQRTYWSNPQLLSERARLRSLDFRLPQARGQYGPQLQYSASYGYQRQSFEQPVGGDVTRAGWGITASAILSQPVFTFGRLRADEDSARAEIAFGRASLRSSEQQILFSAISAYAAVLRDRAGVGIARDNANLLGREFSDTRIRFDVRESTATDLQQVQSRFELARAQLLAAQRAAASSDAAFLRFVGAPAGELAPPNPLEIPARTLEEAYAYADAHNPVLASAYARERISRAAVGSARADLLPRIGLEGRITSGAASALSADLRQTEVRGAISITGTLDSGIREARLGEAIAANDADSRLIDAALRENRAELADAWNEWQTQTAAIARLRAALEAARQAVDGALLQERAGLRTTLEVLELARDLLQVRSSYNATTAAAFVAKARVLAAMGALQHEYLLPEAEQYDPLWHFEKVKGNGDFPLLAPIVRTLDGLVTHSRSDRPVRDPAGPLAVDGVIIEDEPAG